MKNFKNQTIILTGASSGIGLAFAKLIAPENPNIVLVARDPEKLDRAAAEISAAGATTLCIAGDLAQRDFCQEIVAKTIQTFGRLDTLINNAGITLWADFADTSDVAISKKVMDINFDSVMYLTHFALPHVIQSKGALVAVSSISGFIGVPGHAVYAASKHAIHGFYDSLRLELKDTNVQVTIIAPDFVQTEIHYRGLDASGNPMRKRLGSDVAMSAIKCAQIMKAGILRGERMVAVSTRTKLAYPFRGLVPQLIDALALKSRKKHKLV